MTYWKQYIILFGGFQDTSNQTRYLSDIWIFDTVNFVWHCPVLPQAQLKPDARSSFTFLPHESGAVLCGGYSRIKAVVNLKQKSGKGQSQGQKNILKPKVHEDSFFLRMTQPAEGAAPTAPPTVRWERRKKPTNSPNPPRAGATMTWHKGRGILFGGVHDVEASEEGMDSEFFNQLFAWNIERNRFMPLTLRKPRQQPKKGLQDSKRGGGRRGRQGGDEELLRQLQALEMGASLDDVDDIELEKKQQEEEVEEQPAKEYPVTLEPPHIRFNAQLAVQGDNLYIYGGTYEKGDREFTFDDMYAINLDKLDGCKQIFERPVEDWVDSEDEGEDEGEDDDDEDEDDEEEDEEEYEEAEKPFTPSKRKKKQDEMSDAGSETSDQTTPSTSTEEDTASTVDDGLPHPRVSPKMQLGAWPTITNPSSSRSRPAETSSSEPLTSGKKSS